MARLLPSLLPCVCVLSLQDALAFGKTEAQCVEEGVPESLVSHKVFEGNRPSTQILIGEMTPFTVRAS